MIRIKSISWKGDSMNILIACLIVIVLVAIYSPIIYIRRTKKIQKVLEQIEVNTRK